MTVAVIFVSRRTAEHGADYARVAARMDELARRQPGFIDIVSVRDPGTGEGISVSYFADEASALSWKAHPEHLEAQRRGIAEFYEAYDVTVAQVVRAYTFDRAAGSPRASPP